MKISLSNKDPSIKSKGLYNHDMLFCSKILNKRKEYKFPTLGLFSIKMEIKFDLKDFNEVELYNDFFPFKMGDSVISCLFKAVLSWL